MQPSIAQLSYSFEKHYAHLLRVPFDWKQPFTINNLGCRAGDLYPFSTSFFQLTNTNDMEQADFVFASCISICSMMPPPQLGRITLKKR